MSDRGSGSGIVIGLLAALLLALGSAGAWALAEQSVRPGMNRPYESPDIPTWTRRFERPGREVYDRRLAIVDAVGLRPGMAVADIGAGTGLFTRLFAPRVVPGGVVYAVDISGGFLEHIRRTSEQLGLDNVRTVRNTPRETGLPAGSIDIAFLCDTYHHLEYPRSMLRSIGGALRPGGQLIVVDFRKIPGYSSPWVMGHVRAGRESVIDEIESAGFRLLDDRDLLRTNYFLRFAKAGGP